MDKKQFTIKIENLVPTLVDIDAKIPCDNDGYSINFAFDDEWANYRVKTGIFVCGGATHTSVFEGNVCKIPRIKDGTRCYIGVVTGEIAEENAIPDKKTSRWCEVEAVPTITSIADEPSAPSPDVYTEFMALLNKYITEGGGGGLTKDEVKAIVATETEGKVDKIEPPDYGMDYVYSTRYTINDEGTDEELQDSLILVSADEEANTIAMRKSDGRLAVGTPESASDATNKEYVDRVTAPVAKIADHEKRIENLESTLLTFIEDTASAYEKDVPVGVGENAVLSSIRGVTKTSKNLLDPSAFGFTVNEDGSVRVSYDFGDEPYFNDFYAYVTLPKGNYYLTYESKTIRGEDVSAYSRFQGEDGDYVAHLTEEREVAIQIVLEGGGLCEADTYIMLSTDRDAEFEPFGVEKYGKVTAVKSYNSSLIDDVAIFKELGWVKQPNGYWLGKSAIRLNTFTNPENIAERLTISYWVKAVSGTAGKTLITFHVTYTDGTEDYLASTYISTSAYTLIKGTTDAGKTISNIRLGASSLDAGTFEIKDLRFDWGTDVGERVIDTFTIPQEIQSIYGYGKDGFVFDLESKTATYGGKVTDVSAYLTGYNKFKTVKVQGGGKVRFVSADKLPVPSDITYVKAKE